MSALAGSVLTPLGWRRGRVSFGDHVERVEGEPTDRPEPPFVLPGFVDLHVHGGGGGDMMEGTDAIRRAAALHARHGTTSLLATSVTARPEETERFLNAVREAVGADWPDAARVAGAHLEGPFINPGKLGAQPPFAIPADADLLRGWLARAPVRVVTLAPECDPSGALIPLLARAGVRPQIGHSLCAYAEAAAALALGCGVTHLFNAMTPLSASRLRDRGGGARARLLGRNHPRPDPRRAGRDPRRAARDPPALRRHRRDRGRRHARRPLPARRAAR